MLSKETGNFIAITTDGQQFSAYYTRIGSSVEYTIPNYRGSLNAITSLPFKHNMENNMNTIDVYKDLLATFNKHSDVIETDYHVDIRHTLEGRIRLLEVSAMFDIDLDITRGHGGDWHELAEHQYISLYGPDHNRTISWSDDGSQPDSEWLYVIRFPTGAYIFGEQYPTETFRMLFDKLKSYQPKYIDTANHALYFSPENAKVIHNDFDAVFKEFYDLASDELRAKKIEALKAELDKLEATTD